MKRIDGRTYDELRPVEIITGFQSFAEGSVLIKLGKTHVLCAVSVEERVPPFLKGSGTGWITAEYAMLPRATQTRSQREVSQGHVGGRSQEIQRLIGRSLRAIADMKALGERTLLVDCDVLQADGGTRTASITGSFVALQMAVDKLMKMGMLAKSPLKTAVAATSVGIVGNNTLLDLCYDEDSHAGVDFNIVMTGNGDFVEIQGTAEGKPFSRQAIDDILALGEKGIRQLFQFQKDALKYMK